MEITFLVWFDAIVQTLGTAILLGIGVFVCGVAWAWIYSWLYYD